MRNLNTLRPRTLTLCLSAALALAPHMLPADVLRPHVHAGPFARHAQLARTAAASDVNRKGQTLTQVMAELAAHARTIAPRQPIRPAAVLPVSNCDDSGPGSLRDAIAGAATGDVIDLNALSCGTITLTTGAISTALDDLTILGPGASNLTIDADLNSGVFAHYGSGTLAIDGVTIQNGYIAGYAYHGGGCVLSASNVTVDNSTLRHCYSYTAHSFGGAICAVGAVTLNKSQLTGNATLGHFYYYYYVGYPNPYLISGESWGGAAYAAKGFTITASTISDNTAYFNNRGSVGGGIATRSGGDLIVGSTVSGNFAQLGGGIEILGHYPGEAKGLAVLNSTISGNSSYASGGGLHSYRLPYTRIHNSTISNNASGYYCGGAYVYYGVADVQSSIIAGNTSALDTNQFGRYSAADFDIFYDNATLGGDHDLIMTSNEPLPDGTLQDDPHLLPLADNGGPTQTHALPPDSVAVNAGSNPDNFQFDQRGAGFSRTSAGAADIGAFEFIDSIFANGFE
jgi:hypothetical protein